MRSRWLPLCAAAALLVACDAGDGRAGIAPDSGYAMQRVGGNALVLPRGFRITVFAEGLDGVRFLTVGPDGNIYASQPRAGRVVRLEDGDGDGRADTTVTVIDGLQNPHGLAFRADTLYVAEEHRVVRFVPPDGALQVVVADLPEGGHWTRTVIFHGDTMFVSVGSSCNLCDERDPRRAAVTRFWPDGSGEMRFVTGLRNAVGLAVHPETGEIWATNNDRDRLGDDLPPDRVNVLREGGWYGWPVCYLPDTPNPEYRAQAVRCIDAIGPAVVLPAHTAPLGLAFYTGTQFPQAYHGDLFVALHGSWDRSFPVGYKVVRVPMDGGRAAGAPEDFIVGWQIGRRSWGRPVDVLVAPDGALLISDDSGGKVYRVWWGGEGAQTASQ